MSDSYTGNDPSFSRQWRGTRHTWDRAATKEYANMPVTTYKIGPNGERKLVGVSEG